MAMVLSVYRFIGLKTLNKLSKTNGNAKRRWPPIVFINVCQFPSVGLNKAMGQCRTPKKAIRVLCFVVFMKFWVGWTTVIL